jgi:hypothetical protein
LRALTHTIKQRADTHPLTLAEIDALLRDAAAALLVAAVEGE